MCLVFAMNEASEADIEYEDVPYVSYEYPTRYRRRVTSGTRFIYYRGRRRSEGGRQPQVYLGTGIVGEIRPSRVENRLVCEVLDGTTFPEPVSFKDENGRHLEPGGATRGYYQPGVRKISESVYLEIVSRANVEPTAGSSSSTATARNTGGRGGTYASSEVAQEVERQSRRIAKEYLLDRLPGVEIMEMPTNNPGFDLETNRLGSRYIEVKGTQAPVPRFFLSEGERQFGAAHQGDYLLVVVFGMDLAEETHQGIETARGPIGSTQRLEPTQWRGILPGLHSKAN